MLDKNKKWLLVFFTIPPVLILLVVGLVNYVIDPMNIFQHSNKFNNMQSYFDERKIKSYIISQKKNEYNGLLLGSSRVTYYDTTNIKKYKIFNYAFGSGGPYEFQYVIDNYRKNNQLDNLIIGIDFMDATLAKKSTYQKEVGKYNQIFEEIDNSNNLEKFFKNYFLIDMFKNSITNLKRSLTNNPGPKSYNRKNIASVNKVNERKVINTAAYRSKKLYQLDSYKGHDENLINILRELKNKNKDANFFVFTTPLSKPFLDEIMKNDDLSKIYFDWINSLVEIFETVYFTTFYSDIAINYEKYSKDGDHYYPFVGNELLSYIVDNDKSNKFINIKDNILEINKKNLETILKKIRVN